MAQHHVVIFLNSILNAERYRDNYANGVARIMSARYGGQYTGWFAIQHKIFADWASYHADLNYSGEYSMDDIREGQFRVTRALFRLAKLPEPDKPEITALAQTLITDAPLIGISFDDTANQFLQALGTLPTVKMTVTAYFCEPQTRAILDAGGYKQVSVIGADTFEHYEMDMRYFRFLRQHLQPSTQDSKLIYLDTHTDTLQHAQTVGFISYPITPNTTPNQWLNDLKAHLT